MEKLFRMLMSPDMDEYSRAEVTRYVEKIIDEHMKIRRGARILPIASSRQNISRTTRAKRNWRFLKWNASLIVNRRKDYDAQSVNYGDS